MATSQQFCLRWNNYQNNLTQVFEQLLKTESFVDVTLSCEGHSIKAHRMVLSACSPYFQTMLGDTPCSHPIIILQGVEWPDLKAVVEFMYKGEINICQDQLGSLLRVAESLKIRGLADVGGEGEAEAVITSPSESPRGIHTLSWGDEGSRKRRRVSGNDAASRTPSPSTPPTATGPAELLETTVDLPASISRGSSSSGGGSASQHIQSPAASLASSLSALSAHLPGPMPPPGPPMPHLAHLPPLSPLSPLLNMHPMRHHSPDDFEIRPGIAEMIREEERAKLLESSHHWMGSSMADSYQAQVQAAWQKSWNQTQNLLQNLRFRERGPLKSWRPETMAEAIHAVLKEGLSLSQAARKYDIPYPTFVLYANRVHNLLGPSHEPGDLRPKGRGRPQRILLGCWPEDQIKGVIRAVVFRDTAMFRDGEHLKENKIPAASKVMIKDEFPVLNSNGPVTPNSNSITPTPSETFDHPLTPAPPSTPNSTPSTSQSVNGGVGVPLPLASPISTSPVEGMNLLQTPKSEANGSPGENRPPSSDAPSTGGSPPPTTPASTPAPTSAPNTPSATSVVNVSPPNTSPSASLINMMSSSSPATNGGLSAANLTPQQLQQLQKQATQLSVQQTHPAQRHPIQRQQQQQQQQQTTRLPSGGHPPQMMGLLPGNLPPAIATSLASPAHMSRLFGESGSSHAISGRTSHSAGHANTYAPGFNRPPIPAMQSMNLMNPMGTIGGRMKGEEADPSPEALLFSKLTGMADRPHYSQGSGDANARQGTQIEGSADATLDRAQLMYRDGLETLKSEPEPILN